MLILNLPLMHRAGRRARTFCGTSLTVVPSRRSRSRLELHVVEDGGNYGQVANFTTWALRTAVAVQLHLRILRHELGLASTVRLAIRAAAHVEHHRNRCFQCVGTDRQVEHRAKALFDLTG